jgi:hypothetical protein
MCEVAREPEAKLTGLWAVIEKSGVGKATNWASVLGLLLTPSEASTFATALLLTEREAQKTAKLKNTTRSIILFSVRRFRRLGASCCKLRQRRFDNVGWRFSGRNVGFANKDLLGWRNDSCG